MIRLLICAVLFTVFPSQFLFCQAMDPVDSLLMAGQFDSARKVLERSADASHEPYRALVARLVSLPPDSILRRVVSGGMNFREKFLAREAGENAALCYTRFLDRASARQHADAYRQYALAEFFRLRFLQETRTGWHARLNSARDILRTGDHARAHAMIHEHFLMPTPSPLRESRDTVDYLWRRFEKEVRSAEVRERYEGDRGNVERRFLIAFWGSLAGRREIISTHKDRIDAQGVGPGVMFTEANSPIAFSRLDVGAEAGVFMFPSLAAGGMYFRSTQNVQADLRLSFSTLPLEAVASYPADLRFDGWGFFVRYLFDDREGFRPYIQASYQMISGSLTCGAVAEPWSEFRVESIEERSGHAGGQIGVEYVHSHGLPLLGVAFVEGLMNLKGEGLLFSRYSWRIGLKVGILFL